MTGLWTHQKLYAHLFCVFFWPIQKIIDIIINFTSTGVKTGTIAFMMMSSALTVGRKNIIVRLNDHVSRITMIAAVAKERWAEGFLKKSS